MGNVRLIVGLGNPGLEYDQTRHNAGFMVLDRLAGRWRGTWSSEGRFQCRLARVDRGETRFLLCQPQTYMNASGESVGPLARFFQVEPPGVLLVVDDADLDLGILRLRPDGSSGGHHGLESVEKHLGSRQFPRLKVGIGRQKPGVREITGHVLSRFRRADEALVEKVLERACDQIECWAQDGLERAMNRFNGVVTK